MYGYIEMEAPSESSLLAGPSIHTSTFSFFYFFAYYGFPHLHIPCRRSRYVVSTPWHMLSDYILIGWFNQGWQLSWASL